MSRTHTLTTAQRDRAVGAILGMASGDALGAGYEFGPPLASTTPVEMKGGGCFNWAPGEWTDDTSMAIVIARAAASGADLRDEAVQSTIVADWVDWAKTAPDVGIQLSAVLGSIRRSAANATSATTADSTTATANTASHADGTSLAALARTIAHQHHERNGRSAGNGSLMSTAPVALAYLHDPAALAEVARGLSDLTHFEADAGDACVLWCLAIRHAVLHAELDVRIGIDALPGERRALWLERIAEAETKQPRDFDRNGWVVEALQGAWSAIVHSQLEAEHVGVVPDAHQLRLGLEAAVRGGRDTDTVAAIAGGLLGARWGASAVPAAWRRILHGWPGLRTNDLVSLADGILNHGPSGPVSYANYGDIGTITRHPHDNGVYIGAVGALDALPQDVTAIVSLCRVNGTPAGIDPRDHVQVRLIDQSGAAENPNLSFVLEDTADAIAALRSEGKVVLLHCVQAFSRTPTVAALYATRHRGIPAERALVEVVDALPHANPNHGFRRWYAEHTGTTLTGGQP